MRRRRIATSLFAVLCLLTPAEAGAQCCQTKGKATAHCCKAEPAECCENNAKESGNCTTTGNCPTTTGQCEATAGSCSTTTECGGKHEKACHKRYMVGACDWMLLKRQKLGVFKLAKDIGLDGVEIDCGPLGNREMFENELREGEKLQAFQKAIDSLGIAVPSVAMSGFFAQSFLTRPNYEALIDDCLQTMQRLGARTAFLPLGGSGKEWQDKNSSQHAEMVKRLRRAGEMAAAKNLVIGIRTQLSAADDIALLDEVNSKGIRIYYSVQDALDNGRDPAEEIRTLGAKRICQIQCTNTDGQLLKDDTKVNMPAIKKALDDIGWHGWLMLERSRDASKVKDVKYNYGSNAKYMQEVLAN